jgi:hypothetical protein
VHVRPRLVDEADEVNLEDGRELQSWYVAVQSCLSVWRIYKYDSYFLHQHWQRLLQVAPSKIPWYLDGIFGG